MRPNSIPAIVLFVLLGLKASPQTSTRAQSGHMMTFRELLAQRNIELTEPSLVAALRNPDPHVRSWSALILAEDKATDAVPAISETLQSETVLEAKASIALALAQLGGQQGFATLKSMCGDNNIPPYLRVYATMYMLDLDDESCLNTIFEVLQSNADSSSRVLAFSQLSGFHKLSQDDSQRIVNVTLKALGDETTAMRIAASRALSGFPPAIGVPALQNAIAKERNEAVKMQMQSTLQHLHEQETN
jgi:HEAT repeat protein